MKKVQKTLLLCTVISVCSGLMKASSLYDEMWHRVDQRVIMNGKHIEEYKMYSGIYRYYISNFVNLHTVPFKNYKSKELMPKLRKHLEEVAGRCGMSLEDINQNGYRQWDDSSQCPLGSRSFGELMLGIAEEFLLEKLLFLRDYNKATDLALECPCERLCAPFIVYFYRMRAERKWDERFESDDAQRFEQIFRKHLERFKQMRLRKLRMSENDDLITDTAEKICEALFGKEYIYERLKDVMLEIGIFIEEAIDSVDYLDCNYWKPEPIGEEEGRKILEEIE